MVGVDLFAFEFDLLFGFLLGLVCLFDRLRWFVVFKFCALWLFVFKSLICYK